MYREPDINLSKLCINADKIYKDAFDDKENTSNSPGNYTQESFMIPEEARFRPIERFVFK